MNENEQRFTNLLSGVIREGMSDLIDWIRDRSDFFTAPASTQFHMSVEGGLLQHSLNVYDRLVRLAKEEWGKDDMPSSDSLVLCGLLHDLCKANYYTVEMRNRKNEAGKWEQVPFYTVKDKLPYGHGEKSVYIVNGFIRLTREEAMAIRWHMGGFDSTVRGGDRSLSEVFEQYPLALLLHIADMQATYIDEAR